MRINRDEWAMILADATSMRSTCLRRQVGCVLLNERGHVLATGYNGAASGLPHCNERDWDCCCFCGAELGQTSKCGSCGAVNLEETPLRCHSKFAETGLGPDDCKAIHAEANAVLQCRDPWAIDKCYVTRSPCESCVKLLMNTSCKEIVYRDESSHPAARLLWTPTGRSWRLYKPKIRL